MPMPLLQYIPWKLTLFQIESGSSAGYCRSPLAGLLLPFSPNVLSEEYLPSRHPLCFSLRDIQPFNQCKLGEKEEKVNIYLQSDIIRKLIANKIFNIEITGIIDYKENDLKIYQCKYLLALY